jgi:hypothetical protein
MRYILKNEKAEEKIAKVNKKRKSILYYRDNSSNNTCGGTTIYGDNPRCLLTVNRRTLFLHPRALILRSPRCGTRVPRYITR